MEKITKVHGFICELADGVFLTMKSDYNDGNCTCFDNTPCVFEAYIDSSRENLEDIINTEEDWLKEYGFDRDKVKIHEIDLSMAVVG